MSGRIVISPELFSQDEVRRRILFTLNMTKIVQHLWEAVRFENALAIVPQFDKERSIRCTGDMQPLVYSQALRAYRTLAQKFVGIRFPLGSQRGV